MGQQLSGIIFFQFNQAPVEKQRSPSRRAGTSSPGLNARPVEVKIHINPPLHQLRQKEVFVVKLRRV